MAQRILERAMRRGRLAHAIVLSGTSLALLEELALKIGRQILERRRLETGERAEGLEQALLARGPHARDPIQCARAERQA